MARNEQRTRARMDTRRVRTVAAAGGRATQSVVNPPEGWELWYPREKGVYLLRFLPYVVTSKAHPDGVKSGSLWYRRPYGLHVRVGGSDRIALCLQSVGQRCPICAEVQNLRRNYDANRDVIRDIRAKQQMLFAAVDPREPDRRLLFDWSAFKFSDALEKELSEGEVENLDFAQAEGGLVVKFRVVEEEFEGREFLKTDKIDFTDARNLKDLPQELLDSVPALDDCFDAMTPEDLEALFQGGGTPPPAPADDGEEDLEEDAPPPPPPAPKPGKGKTAPPPAPKPGKTAGGKLCKACEGTGVNSKGKTCAACQGSGVVGGPPTPAAGKEKAAPPADDAGGDWGDWGDETEK